MVSPVGPYSLLSQGTIDFFPLPQGSDSAQPRGSHEDPQPFWTYVKNLLGKNREEALICARKDADDLRGPDAAEDDRRLPYIPETFLNLAQDILLSFHRRSLR